MYMYMNASVDVYFYIYKLVLVPNYEWKKTLNLNLILPTLFIFIDILWTSLFMFLIPALGVFRASDIASTIVSIHLYPLNRPIAGVCYINGIKFSWNKARPISRNVYAFCKLLSTLNGFFSNPYRHILTFCPLQKFRLSSFKICTFVMYKFW